MDWRLVPLLLLAIFTFLSAEIYAPKANEKCVIEAGNARFSVLTDYIVRMEYGLFRDDATLAILNRHFDKCPEFTTTHTGNWISINTKAVQISYNTQDRYSFNDKNLKMHVKVDDEWKGFNLTTIHDGNVAGTIRTLDHMLEPLNIDCQTTNIKDTHCSYGLMSRSGATIFDDSLTLTFENPNPKPLDWAWINEPKPILPASHDQCSLILPSNRRMCNEPNVSEEMCIKSGCCYKSKSCFYGKYSNQDLYLLGHGFEFKTALKEFTELSGKIPIPPKYAFGQWYSRYWAYADWEYPDLVAEYEQYDLPLDVMVADMDWHKTFYIEAEIQHKKDPVGQKFGRTGYSWDKNLFPDPQKWLGWCEDIGLKNTVNLHPAGGIQSYEDMYEDMAIAMQIDPKTKKYVPFSMMSKDFIHKYFQIVLNPIAEQGMDFWWLDWQQGEEWLKTPGINPTILLNHIFYTNPYVPKNQRGFFMHRWGGVGSHRYQVGFSGDTDADWPSLNFQPWFTSQSSNVLFGYWCHDLGGHNEPVEPELFTRWMQYGVFSPMVKVHSTKNGLSTRKYWQFGYTYFEVMREFLHLRAKMMPYIYTLGRRAYDTGISIVSPMYYDYPKEDMAYIMKNQFMFGDSMMISPVTSPVDKSTQMAENKVWFPPATEWLNFQTGEIIRTGSGDLKSTSYSQLKEMPIYIKLDSMIPLFTERITGKTTGLATMPNSEHTLGFLMSGASDHGETKVYYDDGVSTDYQNFDDSFGYATANFVRDSDLKGITIQVKPSKSGFKNFQFEIRNSWPATLIRVGSSILPRVNEHHASNKNSKFWYSGKKLATIIEIYDHPTDLSIHVNFGMKLNDALLNSNIVGRMSRVRDLKILLDDQWGVDRVFQEQYPFLMKASRSASVISYAASTPSDNLGGAADVAAEMHNFMSNFARAKNEVNGLASLNADVRAHAMAQLSQSQ